MRFMIVAAALTLGACGDGDELALDGGVIPAQTADCTGTEAFVAGVSTATPGGRTVALLDANPTPPDVGDNSWVVEVSDASGALTGLQLSVRPWMPLHGHGVSPPTYGSTDHGDGTYTIDAFDLIMPGTWEFTVDVGVSDAAPDEAVFSFCAAG